MKKLLIFSVIGLIGVANLASSEPTADEVLANIETGSQGLAMASSAYLQGVHVGYSWANIHLKDTGQKEMFCEPPKFSMTNDQLVSILTDFLGDDEAKYGEFNVGLVLLFALQDVFPCPE